MPDIFVLTYMYQNSDTPIFKWNLFRQRPHLTANRFA